jgi:hypothetical protein
MYIQIYLIENICYVYPLLILYEILDTYPMHIFCIVFSGLDMHMYMHILVWVLGFLGFFLTSYTLLKFRVFKVSLYELGTVNKLSITSCFSKQAFYCILLFWKGFWHAQTPKHSSTQRTWTCIYLSLGFLGSFLTSYICLGLRFPRFFRMS